MKTYIDERPLEEIIQSVILDEKHKEFVEEVMDVLARYEEYGVNPYNGDYTLYDADISRLENRKNLLEKEKETLEKLYTTSFEKVVLLETQRNPDLHAHAHAHEKKEDKQKIGVIMKPAEAVKQKKEQELLAKNFRTTMATTQEELIEFNKELSQITADIAKYTYYQEVALKTIKTLRRIMNHYKIHRDPEFVQKGAYFVKDYSSKLIDRYNKAK